MHNNKKVLTRRIMNYLGHVENGDGPYQRTKFDDDVKVGEGIGIANGGTDFRRNGQNNVNNEVPE
jgi:hypothetical protein